MNKHRVGVVSDTHGLLRPQAIKALSGVEHIIHAGDVGNADILTALQAVAPVTAVRGNTDYGPVIGQLPETEVVQIGDTLIYVLHDIGLLNLDPAAAGFHAVIFGHSHRPDIETPNGVLYLNPGSIGPRRFTLPITLAILHIDGAALEVEQIELEE